MKNNSMNRRNLLKSSASLGIGLSAASQLTMTEAAAKEAGYEGQVKHSACKWCYRKIELDDFCQQGKEIGLHSVELLKPEDFPTLHKYDLDCAMVSFPSVEKEIGGEKKKIGPIAHAFNRVEHHDTLVELYTPYIKECVEAGFKNIICFSGNRFGMDDEEGLKNCAIGLKRLMPLCEKLGVTLSMELLNSKVNHKDYMADTSSWGAALCEEIGSESFKLLYDIYHMQIMEGDVIATIKERHKYFSHYHTGGVPGRAEIDETQELYYPAIIKAIYDTGYQGFIGQEFIPKKADKIASLKDAVERCSV